VSGPSVVHHRHRKTTLFLCHTFLVVVLATGSGVMASIAFGTPSYLLCYSLSSTPGLILGFALVSPYARKQGYPHTLAVAGALWLTSLASTKTPFASSVFVPAQAMILLGSAAFGQLAAFFVAPPEGASRIRYLARRAPILLLVLFLVFGGRFILTVPPGKVAVRAGAVAESPELYLPGLYFPVNPFHEWVFFDAGELNYAEAMERYEEAESE